MEEIHDQALANYAPDNYAFWLDPDNEDSDGPLGIAQAIRPATNGKASGFPAD